MPPKPGTMGVDRGCCTPRSIHLYVCPHTPQLLEWRWAARGEASHLDGKTGANHYFEWWPRWGWETSNLNALHRWNPDSTAGKGTAEPMPAAPSYFILLPWSKYCQEGKCIAFLITLPYFLPMQPCKSWVCSAGIVSCYTMAGNKDVEGLATTSCSSPIIYTLSSVGAAEFKVHMCYKTKKVDTKPLFSCPWAESCRSISTYSISASFAFPLTYI